jgi:hypothetical protein
MSALVPLKMHRFGPLGAGRQTGAGAEVSKRVGRTAREHVFCDARRKRKVQRKDVYQLWWLGFKRKFDSGEMITDQLRPPDIIGFEPQLPLSSFGTSKLHLIEY